MSLASSQQSGIKQKQLDDGTVLKAAGATDVAMRTVKCTDSGLTMKFGSPVEEQEADYTHAKIEFLKFKLKEPRVNSESGYVEKYNCTLDDFETKQQVSKLVLKVGSDEFAVQTQNGKLQLMLAKAIVLPCKAFLSMEYVSPCGGHYYIDEHPLNLAFGAGSKGSQTQCCVIC